MFPGTQGGPLMQVIAGKAVAFKLAAEETFREDQRRTVENARVMAETLAGLGARVVSGSTDNHLMLVDVTPLGVTGKEAEHLLDEIGITVNKNAIPFDKLPPNTASGIRIGTPATTSRGFGPDEMRAVGRIIIDVIRRREDPVAQDRLAGEVREIVSRFPVPGCRPRDIAERSPAITGHGPDDLHRDCRQRDRPDRPRLRVRGLLALVLTPIVRWIVLRYEIVDQPEARRVNTVPVPRGGGLAVCPPRSSWSPASCWRSTTWRRSCRWPRSSRPRRWSALLLGGALAATLGAIDDLFDLRARWQLLGQIALATGTVAAGITIDFIANPLGGSVSVSRRRSRPVSRFSGSWA